MMTIIDEIERALGNHRRPPVAICLGKHQFDRYCEFLGRLIKSRTPVELQSGAVPARDAYLYNNRYIPIKRMSEADHLSIE
jgi:hypothetical protein